MKRYLILTLLAFVALAGNVGMYAQTSDRGKWIQEVRKYKHDMLVKEVGMTPAQQNEFFPLYTQMEREIFQANKEARDLEYRVSNSRSSVSEAEYEKAAEALANVKLREGQIETAYFQKFARILTKKQLFLLKRAETRFTRSMLDHHRAARTQK